MNRDFIERIRLGRIHCMADPETGAGGGTGTAAPPAGSDDPATPPPQDGEPPPELPKETEEERQAAEEAERKAKNREFAERRIKERQEREARAAARAEGKYLAEIEALRREMEGLKGTKPPPAAETSVPPKPKQSDFQTWEEYHEASLAWVEAAAERRALEKLEAKEAARVEKDRKDAEAKQSEEKTRQAEHSLRATFDRAEAEYRKTLGDDGAKAYEQASESLTPFLVDEAQRPYNPDVNRALLKAGPAVIHYYADHLDELERLVALDDPEEIRLEVYGVRRQVQDGGRHGRRYTKAAEPPPKVGGGTPPADRPYAELSGDEFLKRRMAEISATSIRK